MSWASSHLEGNTYSRLDTVALIGHDQAARGKATIETLMILNHKSAIELLVESASAPGSAENMGTTAAGLNRYLLMNLYSALAENLLPGPSAEGCVRQSTVDIRQACTGP